MKHLASFTGMALFLAIPFCISSPVVHAQQYAKPVDYCITEFYDSQSYNWLAYRNNCGMTVHIQFVANNNGSISGSMDIRPGGHQGIGRSASEVNAAGGVRHYACPEGYIAFDTNGNYINNVAVTEYVCKQQ